jgi:putative CocE/NonD family hydrolase
VIRARFRNGLEAPELIESGAIYRYEIDLWFTSNEFQPGHRIALAVSSSNFPRFNRNLNTGGDNEQERDFAAASQTIFHDSRHPSHLVLPVIES